MTLNEKLRKLEDILNGYGQMLVALSAATELGCTVSAFEVLPLLFYPMMLLVSSLVFIFIIPDRKAKEN